jgi:hypothetical protein
MNSALFLFVSIVHNRLHFEGIYTHMADKFIDQDAKKEHFSI